MGAIANNWEDKLKNEILKEAFLEATSERKIEFIVNDKQNSYWDVNFKNGAVVVSHKKSIANISNLEYFDLAPKIPSPGLPLVTKMNLNSEQNQQHLQDNLEKINKATGENDWSFEADFAAIFPQLDKNSQDRLGDIYYREAMGALASCLEKKLQSETVKEAFNEAASAHKIIFRVNDKSPNYWNIKFENGNVVVDHKKSIANISNLEYYDLEKVIPTPGLSLVVKLDIEKYKEKLDEKLAELSQITGNDWAVEIDFDAIVPQLDEYARNSIGNIYYGQAFPALVSCIKTKLESESVKEAFNEATSERKVIFKVNDKQPSYWNIAFQNGSLVVSHKKSIANISNLEYYNLEEIIPVPGTFPLVAKLNIEKNRPVLDEHLQKISEATGQEYTFDDACLEALYPKLEDHSKARIGDVILKESMGYLAANLTKALKDEMVLEAFNEIATAHQITYKHQNPTPNYWAISFKDGVVVVSFQACANLSNLEYLNIESLL